MRTFTMLAAVLGGSLVVALSGPAMAQYKVVGPDGKVTYTDTPPASPNVKAVGRGVGESVETDNLPYELRQVTGRFPVTLLSTANCGPCDSVRNLLRQRGVPYTEKTVTTAQDVAALQRSEGGSDLPVVRIGSQQIKGFHAGELGGYLDAAGYPKQSRLPPGYKFRQATPLVAVENSASAAAPAADNGSAAATPATDTAPPEPRPSGNGASGDAPPIRF